MPFWPNLLLEGIQNDFSELIPIQFLKKHLMIPLNIKAPLPAADSEEAPAQREPDPAAASGVVIAIHSPAAFPALDDLIRIIAEDQFQIVFSTKSAILNAISDYTHDDDITFLIIKRQ